MLRRRRYQERHPDDPGYDEPLWVQVVVLTILGSGAVLLAWIRLTH